MAGKITTKKSRKGPGTSRSAIEQIQKALNQLLGTEVQLDGILGPQTREAIKKFQDQSGLEVDGLLGPITKNAINKALSTASKSAKVRESSKSLEQQLIETWLDPSPDRETERSEAQAMLLDPKATIDRQVLIKQIVSALRRQKVEGAWGPRSWLLSSLARICGEDSRAIRLLHQYMDQKHEPEPFVRYWILAGAYEAQNSELESFAKRVLGEDDDPLVRRLAEAIFAEQGDQRALESLQKGLAGDKNSQWSVLRALRIVSLPQLKSSIEEIEANPPDKILLWNAHKAIERMERTDSLSTATNDQPTGQTDTEQNEDSGNQQLIWLAALDPQEALKNPISSSDVYQLTDAGNFSASISPEDFLVLYQTGKTRKIVGLGTVSSIGIKNENIMYYIDLVFDNPIGQNVLHGALPHLFSPNDSVMLKKIGPDDWPKLREIIRFHVPESNDLMPGTNKDPVAGCELLMTGERPTTLTPGARCGFTLKVVNTGTLSWERGDSLVIEGPGLTKEDLLPEGIPPGGERIIDITLEAPTTPGPARIDITARVDHFGGKFSFGSLSQTFDVLPSAQPEKAEKEPIVTEDTQRLKEKATKQQKSRPAKKTIPNVATTKAAKITESSPTDQTSPKGKGARPSRIDIPERSAGGVTINSAQIQKTMLQAFQPPKSKIALNIQQGSTTLTFGDLTFTSPTKLNFEKLRELSGSAERYGEELFSSIIRTEKNPGSQFLDTRHGYQEAVGKTGQDIRIELLLDASDPELRSLQWEYLTDPESHDPPISVNQRTPFYRLVGNRKPPARPKLPFKVLVAIANPDGLGRPGHRYLKDLPPLEVARERQIIVDALSPLKAAGVLSYTILDQTSGEHSPTVENITEMLKQEFHVLHLLAHGLFIDTGEYCVALPGKEKANDLVTVSRFRATIAGNKLRLTLLQTCQSFSVGSRTSGQALGLGLIEAGIPAVISMQDKLPVETAQFFTQHFYHDLSRSGRVDMAVAATRHALYLARQRIGNIRDWGLPVLQLGITDGRLFSVKKEDSVRLGDPDPQIKSAGELPGNIDVPQTTDLANDIVEEVEKALRSTGNNTDIIAPLSERIRNQLKTALPESSAPVTDLPQDRAALRWNLRNPFRLYVPKFQEWVERHTKIRLLPSVYRQLAAALNAGKHIILIGPPGTGKTSLAHAICDYARNTGLSAGSVPTTASSDWTTFDTVGGYALTPNQALEFRPGIFLRAISEGKWLVIDEINRAEIDKAVGELFTLLSGQQVDLPYHIAGHQVRILPTKTSHPTDWIPEDASTYDYVVHPNWRILATMNVYDKSSLFSMSFAFMRRFAFIDVGVPHHGNIFHELRAKWIEDRLRDKTNLADRNTIMEKMNEVFDKESPLMRRRELGPAIASDMLRYIEDRVSQVQEEQDAILATGGTVLIEFLGEAFLLYAVPQLDGLDREAVLEIYSHIDAIFDKVMTGSDILRRLEDLYPHIRGDEWKARQPTSG